MGDETSVFEPWAPSRSEVARLSGAHSPLFFRMPPGAGDMCVSHEPASFGVRMTERRHVAMVNVRGQARVSRFIEAMAACCDMRLPLAANTASSVNGMLACWMSPDEWLLLGAPGTAKALVERLTAHLEGLHFAVTDVSSGHTTIRLRGEQVQPTLAKGCALDLHEAVFTPGQCAQTLIAKTQVLIIRRSGCFDLIVRRSFADYLWLWLSDAAAEYELYRDAEVADRP
ncbi:MAG: sarcosine oxidase subunit gamma [Gammaproteobacteria bacterium]|nr:sarcosine oxidase subunit gamma [Gammaproteobacteria bacterium]